MEVNRKCKTIFMLASPLVFASMLAQSQDIGTPDPDLLTRIYPGKAYSPYAERSFPNNVFWGETHVHTGLSLDAGLFGNILGHEDAYRFARGEQITSSGGLQVKLGRPLDWLVITDHSDMMGIAADIQSGAPNILANSKGKEWAEGFKKGGAAAGEAAFDLITHFAQMIGSPLYMSPEQAQLSVGGCRYTERCLFAGRAALRTLDRQHAVRPEADEQRLLR